MVDFLLEDTVKLTITLPDNVARKVCRLPDPDGFVSRAVEKALEQNTLPAETPKESSKWARLVSEIEEGSMSLGEQAARFDRDRREFREQFRFRHDDALLL